MPIYWHCNSFILLHAFMSCMSCFWYPWPRNFILVCRYIFQKYRLGSFIKVVGRRQCHRKQDSMFDHTVVCLWFKGLVGLFLYLLQDVTPDNFLAALSGREDLVKGIGSGKVIKRSVLYYLLRFVDSVCDTWNISWCICKHILGWHRLIV